MEFLSGELSQAPEASYKRHVTSQSESNTTSCYLYVAVGTIFSE